MHNPRIPRAPSQTEETMVAWGDDEESRKIAFKAMSETIAQAPIIQRTSASTYYDYSDLQSNVSGRPGLDHRAYYQFRPQEAPRPGVKGEITDAEQAYRKVGLVRNVIDLMGDFAAQGVRIVHPNKRIEKFYQSWFNRVKGKDRSERFLNNLYRTGNVIIRIQNAKLKEDAAKNLFKTIGKTELSIDPLEHIPGEIPWKYIFVSPLVVDVVGGPLAAFVGKPVYVMKLPPELKSLMKKKDPIIKAMVDQLPEELKKAAKNTNNKFSKGIPLPPDRTRVFHYKKDDWNSWASPMIAGIIDDINVYTKMRLADMAALDGAISKIRIFKLGDFEHKIAPTPAAAAKLASILEAHVGGGTIDLVWTPDITIEESDTNVHNFLGEDKYKPSLMAIYDGLGIPPTLTGSFGNSGTTNNYISLKTLTQRLGYGRAKLTEFWQEEIVKVQKAMGFRFSAKIEFDFNTLGDEVAEKQLLLQLADRALISDELIQQRFGHDADLEKIRLNREERERSDGKRVLKASPWHDPQPGNSFKKIGLQSGVLAPSQIGLLQEAVLRQMRLLPKKKGEKTALEMRSVPKNNLGGQPQQGRPPNSNDKEKRKRQEFTPRNRAEIEIWAKDAQGKIAEFINPLFLGMCKKKNMRSLSSKEFKTSEDIKFDIFFHLSPLCNVTDNLIDNLLAVGSVDESIKRTYDGLLGEISQRLKKQMTVEEQKNLQVILYSNLVEMDNG